MSGVTGAVVGAAVVGAGASVYSANKAAGAAKSAANSSIAEQQREYDQARADNAPYRVTGMSGLNQVAKLYGLDTVDENGNVTKGSGKADLSGFTTSPDFQFDLSQGQDAINRSAAARGGLLSGAAVKAGQTYATGLADQNFGNYVSRLSGIAGVGQSATNATTAAGTNMANANSQAITGAGNARASAYLDQGQTIGNLANGGSQLASQYLLYKYLNPGTSATQQPLSGFSPNYSFDTTYTGGFNGGFSTG
jgi:hypothetical protein